MEGNLHRSSGIGRAIAIQFAQEGADIIIVYHTDQEGAERTRLQVEAAGQRAFIVQADASDANQADIKQNDI